MRLTSAGNVGIGTTTPTFSLDLVGNWRQTKAASASSAIGYWQDVGGANNSYFALYQNTNTWLYAVGNNGTGTRKNIRFSNNDYGNDT